MPVTTHHKQYEMREKQWKRCKVTVEGSDAVKEEGENHLPSLGSQDGEEYSKYKMRALFYGASGRTVQGLLGALFRKDYVIEFPKNLEPNLERVTSRGLKLVEFVRKVASNVLVEGRTGILVDVAREGDMRAYMSSYTALDIINWRVEVVDGVEKLTRVVLRETYNVPNPKDQFEFEEKTQYRVLSIVKGVYEQNVWRKVKKGTKEDWAPDPDLRAVPNRAGKALDFIPFQFINTFQLTPDVDKPHLIDLVDVNLSHYRTSADHEHGAHYTALPTAFVVGFPVDQELTLGAGTAWISDNPGASAGFLEFTGQGLGALAALKQEKEQLMAILGARMLEEPKAAVEATATHKLRSSGETSVLVNIARTTSDGIEQGLKWMAWWSSASEEGVKFELNNDFVDAKMDPQEMTSLVAAWQGGAISQDTFLWNLKRGEVIPPDVTAEDEKDKLDAEGAKRDDANVPPTETKKAFELVKDKKGKTTGVKEK